MRSMERSKKKLQPWKKSLLHFLICFIMGFFTGFAPTAKSSILSNRVAISNPSCTKPYESVQKGTNQLTSQNGNFNRSLLDTTSEPLPTRSNDAKRLVIIVTSTSAKDQLRGVLLARMANTLKLVRPPLLWVVVEQKSESSSEVSEMLRETGIMYRHLEFKENFADIEAEMDHQWNVALEHIEHHKLSGIVHFTGLSNVYDLSFFEQIRGIEVFGTWPIAILAANRKRVVFKRPLM